MRAPTGGAQLALAGGSMMATSLVHIAAAFDASRLDMAPLGRLFGGFLVAALLLWRRHAKPASGGDITCPLCPTTPRP